MRRFAAGTAAGWALHRMNQTLDAGLPQGSLIEAVKEGEEPVTFGPSAVLAHYGQGWSLQTIPEEGTHGGGGLWNGGPSLLKILIALWFLIIQKKEHQRGRHQHLQRYPNVLFFFPLLLWPNSAQLGLKRVVNLA